MAALRRRRTDEENVSEPAEEAQATLDFGPAGESEAPAEQAPVEETASEE